MAVKTDAAGEPLRDPTGDYIPATHVGTGEPFDASSPSPIDGTTITNYGHDIGGATILTLTPGYYPGGIQLSGPVSETEGKKIELLPGVYALGGGDGHGGDSGLVVTGGMTPNESKSYRGV
jgi:hypothetical protein